MSEEMKNKIMTVVAVLAALCVILSGKLNPIKVETYKPPHTINQEQSIPLTDTTQEVLHMDESTHEYDSTTFYAKAWFEIVNDGTMDYYNGKKIGYTKNHMEFDCANGNARMLEFIFYDTQDKVLASYGVSDWQSIAPQSDVEYFYNLACAPYYKR